MSNDMAGYRTSQSWQTETALVIDLFVIERQPSIDYELFQERVQCSNFRPVW